MIGLEMKPHIATLCWVHRARMKHQDVSSLNRRKLRCCLTFLTVLKKVFRNEIH